MNVPVRVSQIAKAQFRCAGVDAGWPLSPRVETRMFMRETPRVVLNLGGGASGDIALAGVSSKAGVDRAVFLGGDVDEPGDDFLLAEGDRR